MAEGIRDKVAIIGMGCTRFGERWDEGAEDLIIEAYNECINDAGVDLKDIEAAWLGTAFAQFHAGTTALPLSTTLKLPFIPVTRVENACATGTEAFRGACYAVASGACDIALAVGVEKLKDVGYAGLPGPDLGRLKVLIGDNGTAPGWYALSANRYFSYYNVSPDEGKGALAHISYKSHQNGVKNPKAHLRKAVTIDQILNAPMIASPLGLFDCCGVSDGAAAAIVTTPEIARSMGKDPVLVKSVQIAASSGEEYWHTDWDGASLVTAYKAGERAYKEAGIRNPRDELSMMEVHDCFSITELLLYESLQISPRGKAIEDVMDGFFDLNGPLPCQPDGGLKCFGHPVGASGLRMLYEMYNQLLERAGERQIKNARIGLTHNMGGMPFMNVCSVAIVGRD